MPVALLVIELDDDTLIDSCADELILPLDDIDGVALVDAEVFIVNEFTLDNEEDPETDTKLERDTDVLDETDPVGLIVVETDDVGNAEELTLAVIVLETESETMDVTLTKELDDTEVDKLGELEVVTLAE